MRPECAVFRDVAPELALGVAEGDERAAALDHLATCDDCRAELARLTEVVDAVVQTAPAAEPSAGFEVRALASFDGLAASPSRPVRGIRRIALAAAVLVAVVALAALVGSALVRDGRASTEQSTAERTTAALTAPEGMEVGSVAVERRETGDGAHRSELVVSVDPGTEPGTYRVECDYETGRPYQAGELEVTAEGVDDWRAMVSVPTYDLRRVRLVSTDDADNLEAEFPS